ncbi:PilZ domain-containing protein [Hoeflea sp. YIM 152468]|uniref:PilZ domain-containing protein n=1 Tax=Hoeflea sp. YIM 152468 TaxID=3031759 RepID=UPI0023D97F7F|nr:PilZ domain-containing protein [Hoeflea sp. YIM 152468]MDF1609849.1 PilZ domain-containing protein [Hoeflea sp. YIM 152468]
MSGTSRRVDPRDPTQLRATITCMGRTTEATVIDISQSGMCIYLNSHIPISPGEEIVIKTTEMGFLTGIVRWFRRPRLGAELDMSSNTAAKVESFYKIHLKHRKSA